MVFEMLHRLLEFGGIYQLLPAKSCSDIHRQWSDSLLDHSTKGKTHISMQYS